MIAGQRLGINYNVAKISVVTSKISDQRWSNSSFSLGREKLRTAFTYLKFNWVARELAKGWSYCRAREPLSYTRTINDTWSLWALVTSKQLRHTARF